MRHHLKIKRGIQFAILGIILLGFTSSQSVFAAGSAFKSPFQNNLVGAAPTKIAEQLKGEGCAMTTGVIPAFIEGMMTVVGMHVVDPDIPATSIVTITDYECNLKRIQNGEEPLDTGVRTSGLGGIILNSSYAMLDQRPASGVVFAFNHFDQITNPPNVYAQSQGDEADIEPYFPGTGYDLLTPIQTFWGWSVTISMGFMTFIILLVAFAMLFRSRLGGKQVVQIQNAIPSIVMAMILIPLSYPISGLFIDAITLGTNVYHGFMFSPGGPGRGVWENGREPAGLFDILNDGGDNSGEGNTGEPIIRRGSRGLYADDPRLGTFGIISQISVTRVANPNLDCDTKDDGDDGDSVGTEVCETITGASSWVIGAVEDVLSIFGLGSESSDGSTLPKLIIQGIFTVLAVVTSFRIMKRLLLKFLMMMLLPILSPFVFATVAIPGRGMEMVNWYVRRMASVSLFYIATYASFITSIVLSNPEFYKSIPNASTYSYTPPLLSPTVSGLFSGVGGGSNALEIIFTLLAAGIFIMTPRMLDDINKRLGVKDGLPPILRTVGGEVSSTANIGFRTAPATALGISRDAARLGGNTAKLGISPVVGLGRGIRGVADFGSAVGLPIPGLNRYSSENQKAAAIQRQVRAENRLAEAQDKTGVSGFLSRQAAKANMARVKVDNKLTGNEIKPGEGQKQELAVKLLQTQSKAELSNNTIRLSAIEAENKEYYATLEISSSQYDMPKGSKIKITSGGTEVAIASYNDLFTDFKEPAGSKAGIKANFDAKVATELEKTTKKHNIDLILSPTTGAGGNFKSAIPKAGVIYSSEEIDISIGAFVIKKVKINIINTSSK